MMRRAGATAVLAGLAMVLAMEGAPAQGIFDLFGDDSPARGRAPPPSRDVPRAEKKRPPSKPKKRESGQAAAAPEAQKPGAGGPEAPPAPYEAQMTRLTEVLGALAFLRDLCGAGDGDDWRAKMAALIDAEAPSGARREKFVGSFNRGFRGYELTYRVCTPNAQAAISRYLDEASKLSLDITYRYGSP